MAAYAALVSVLHIIDRIQIHPHPPICLDENQIQSLTENVTFLQEFLELYSHVHNEEADRLQSRIADVAYAAEDVIESHIVDHILPQSADHVEKISGHTVDFYPALQKVIQDMDLIKKEVMEIKEKMGSAHVIQLHKSGSVLAAGSSQSPSKGHNITVGLDGILSQLVDKLTGYESNRQIIQIVGMGGIGKTTLARNAYENPLIMRHFDICAWVTISQEYSMKDIILEILSCEKNQENKENLGSKSVEKLEELLHKCLFDRRYLIVMDDLWNIEVWDKLNFLLPDNNNGSRVVITTRLSSHALLVPPAFVLEMNFLNEELSWILLHKIVFGEYGCPLELEEIAKKIAKKCKGLPLAIVVIGGLLAKSEKTRKYWEDIAEKLNSIVNSEDNEYCFKLLYTSYNHLPVHLKPCFLYMGIFPEDADIPVSDLIKLWAAEGFLKPIIGKSLEEAAEEYLKDLICRNLILILEWKLNGKIKFCKIHDLIRDLCLKEAQKEKFLCVTKMKNVHNSPQRIAVAHRIVINGDREDFEEVCDAIPYASLARSLIGNFFFAPPLDCGLMRVWKSFEYQFLCHNVSRQVNLRYLVTDSLKAVNFRDLLPTTLKEYYNSMPSWAYCLWNLETLSISRLSTSFEIWRMPLLKHVEFHELFLPDPPDDLLSYCLEMSNEQNDFVLGNLQTLSNVVNLRCSEKMVKMISNIKKLRISYGEKFEGSYYCLNNLVCLHNLESLNLNFLEEAMPRRSDLLQNLSFPHSLKKLILKGCNLHWKDISIKIGALPLLQMLKIKRSFHGLKWETVEGQFLSLKILQIDGPCNLRYWTTDSTHFPCLEHLGLKKLFVLKEIPSSIGDITTLQSIKLYHCSSSADFSAKNIEKEQEELGNDSLQLQMIERLDKARTSDPWITITRISPMSKDGYEWRKMTSIPKQSEYLRYWYWCKHQGCEATKIVQQIKEDPILYRIKYYGFHSCTYASIVDAEPAQHSPLGSQTDYLYS